MKHCPWCGRGMMDRESRVCPYTDCAHVLTPESGSLDTASSASSSVNGSSREMPLPSPPPPGTTSGEMPLPSPPPPRTSSGEMPLPSPPPPGTTSGEMPLPSPPPPGSPPAETHIQSIQNRQLWTGGRTETRPAAYPRHPERSVPPQEAPCGLSGNASSTLWSAIARATRRARPPGQSQGIAFETPLAEHTPSSGYANTSREGYHGRTDQPQVEAFVLHIDVKDLCQRVQYARRRRAALAVAVAVAIGLSALGSGARYLHGVLGYAELAPSITLEPDPLGPERLILHYRPRTTGRLAFRRVGADRSTELFDEVSAEAVGQDQILLWQAKAIGEGERIGVRFRDGWRLMTHELVIPQTEGDQASY